MTARKPKPLGESIEVPNGTEVLRPDDSVVTVSGGLYVLDVVGDHYIGGRDGSKQPVEEAPAAAADVPPASTS